MYKLRQTWSAILPNQRLYMIDVKIHKMLDPAWPITAKPDKTNMHVNPKFLHVSSKLHVLQRMCFFRKCLLGKLVWLKLFYLPETSHINPQILDLMCRELLHFLI